MFLADPDLLMHIPTLIPKFLRSAQAPAGPLASPAPLQIIHKSAWIFHEGDILFHKSNIIIKFDSLP